MFIYSQTFSSVKLVTRVALALVFFAITVFFRFIYVPLVSGGAFVTFYPAIILSFYFCGTFSGVLVTVLSGLVGVYYFTPPYNQISLNFHIPVSFIFFSITSSLIGIFSANLHRSIEKLNIILDNEMVGSMMLKNREIVWCNKAMSTILGYAQVKLIGASMKMLFADVETFDKVGRDAYPLKDGVPYRTQYEMRKSDGNRIWVDISGAVIPYNENLSFWLVNDISNLKKLELDLKNQVNFDFLTGLHSRAWFLKRSELEFKRSIRYELQLSLLMIDVDFFKKINDTYGHSAGDLILKSISTIILNTFREFDICGRLGGEEFAVLLPETNKGGAHLVAERLRTAIENANISLILGEPSIKTSVSIGVSSLITKIDSIGELLNRADKALYEAKNTGRNKVC